MTCRTLFGALVACLALIIAAPSADAAGGSKRKPTSSGSYVAIPPVIGTVVDTFRIKGVIHVEAGLDIPDSELRDHAQHMMPRLRDAYANAISRYLRGYYVYGEVPDADRIATMLQEVTDTALADDGAHLLVGMVIIHEVG